MTLKTQAFDLADGWSAGAKYTAAAEIAVVIGNSDETEPMFFVIGDDDTVPTIAPAAARRIEPAGERVMTLASGERLWMRQAGGVPGNVATVSW